MSTTYLPTVVALAGSALGGLISFATAWLTQRHHDRAKRLSGERPDDSICTSNSAMRPRRSTPTRWSTIRRTSRRWSASTRSSAEAAMRPIVERASIALQISRSRHLDWRPRRPMAIPDAGTLVHPDGALAQVEGSALWGLSMALYEGTEFVKGQVKDTNFDSYTPLRIGDVPELDIEFIESIEAPVGLGEPGTTVVAPAIGNAIYAATGIRLRHLPIRPTAVLERLASQRRGR